ncbi:MAG: DNA-3-methyladenine glycosylase [Gemmatimonadaceae bacterium]|nr:DNA-3-methyladenine glycosylase [Gemmatimonadaceae bacterium]
MPSRAAATSRRTRGSAALPAKFYDRDTEQVARDLLGAVLRCTTASGAASGRIVETEAYLGEHDLACHAAAGRTARTRWLYGAPGTAYVYFIYGVHWCFNAVTRAVGAPSAVLIRAIEPLEGVELMRERRGAVRERDLTNGPGKLCAALGITGALNGLPLDGSAVEILRGERVPDSRVQVTPRIGITKSAEWPLRWLVADNPYVSKTPRHLRST